MDFAGFASEIDKTFGHLSPTLRSITLIFPRGSYRKIQNFLRLFQRLDDVKIVHYIDTLEADDPNEAPRDPIQGSLQGKLSLRSSEDQCLMAKLGGMRFTSMEFGDMGWAQPFLDACAETLQVFRFHPDRPSDSCKFSTQVARDLS